MDLLTIVALYLIPSGIVFTAGCALAAVRGLRGRLAGAAGTAPVTFGGSARTL